MVIAGFHPSSSFRIDRQTVPEGYTFGWKRGGTNLPIIVSDDSRHKNRHKVGAYTWAALLGTLRTMISGDSPRHVAHAGCSPSGNATSSLNRPPSHSVLSLPGMEHSHFFRSNVP